MSQELQFSHRGNTYAVPSEATQPNTVIKMPEGGFATVEWSDGYPPVGLDVTFTRSSAGRKVVEARRVDDGFIR